MLLTTELRDRPHRAASVRTALEDRTLLPRTFKVGTRIKDRRLDEAGDLKKCLALDAVTAFRVREGVRLLSNAVIFMQAVQDWDANQ